MPHSPNPAPPTYAQKMRGLKWLLASTAANTVFAYLTVFGAVFVLFLNKLGISNGRIGLIMSFLPFCGLLAIVTAPIVARIGLKKTYLIFWTMRKCVVAGILLTPYVLERWGSGTATLFVAGCVLVFALCRSIGETAVLPWMQEIVPDDIRGRYAALNNILANVASMITALAAGYYIRSGAGLAEFQVLMGVGVFFGLVSVWFTAFVPGGAPVLDATSRLDHIRDMAETLTDPVFRRYLTGVGLLALGSGLGTFLPLYLKDVLGIKPGYILFLTVGGTVGALAASYYWGRAVDRYGARPILTWSLSVSLLIPMLWLMIPAGAASATVLAMALMFASGAFQAGWGCADSRMLYVDVVPHDKGTRYLAVYYAWMGLFGGLSPLLAGQVTELARGLHGEFYFVRLSPYTPFFLAVFIMTAAAMVMLRRVATSECP